MTTLYIPIEGSWSWHFLDGAKSHLTNIDCFHFTDHIYTLISEYVKLTHNFRINQSNVLHNDAIHAMWMDLERRWDIPVPYYQVKFRELFNSLLCVSNCIPKEISAVFPVTDDKANLTGFVFTLM